MNLLKHLVVTGTYICQKHLVVTGTYICQKFLITQKNVVRSFLHHRKISNFSDIIMKNQLSRFTKKSMYLQDYNAFV